MSISDKGSEEMVRVQEIEAARLGGYRVELGKPEDGDLNGRWWWTLCRPGWSGVETSIDEYATEDEAWDDAIAAHRGEQALEEQ